MTDRQYAVMEHLLRAFHQRRTNPTRTQLHKILFFVQEESGEEDFPFVLHTYGPYSFELDQCIQQLVDAGYIAANYDARGYGARYELREGFAPDTELTETTGELINRWVDQLSNSGVRELELKATSLFMGKRNQGNRASQQQSVKKVKPHFSDAEITGAFEWLEANGVL